MPFGVKNAPAVFQELIAVPVSRSQTVQYATLLFTATRGRHIRLVLETLRQAGLTANPKKCKWGGKSMDFLGHQVGGGRMSMPRKQ